MLTPKFVIFHCSATPDYPISNKNYDLFGAREINIWHKERGFDEIGYHFVIRRSGAIEQGRSIEKIGAHCQGHNTNSIGVCYIGTRIPSAPQLKSIKQIYADLKEKYGIQQDNWFTHNHFNPHKECPGFSIENLRLLLD